MVSRGLSEVPSGCSAEMSGMCHSFYTFWWCDRWYWASRCFRGPSLWSSQFPDVPHEVVRGCFVDSPTLCQPRQQRGSSTWLKSRRSHRTPRWWDRTGADQLLHSEGEGASRGDTERSSTAWTDVDYLHGLAGLNQTTPNRPQAILVCKGWACCWGRSCVQRAKSRRS